MRAPALIGRVLRANGLKGEIKVELYRPRRGARDKGFVFLDGEQRKVVRARFTDPLHAVVKLEALDDRTGAEALKGKEVFADLDRDDSALIDDADRVLFARVIDANSGAELGTIADLQDNGAQVLLSIKPIAGGEERLVPFVPELIEIDREDGAIRVKVHALPGLLED